MLRIVSWALAAFVASLLPPAMAAELRAEQTRPVQPVRLLVGSLRGSRLDAVARLLVPHLTERLNQPFVVERRWTPPSSSATR